MSEERAAGSIWTSWILPLVIVIALVAAFGAAIASVAEIPYTQACAWAVVAVVGLGGYFFAEHWLYAAASRRLGYRCELRPQPRPHSAQYDADLVITGSLRGHAFTLYRERHNSTTTSAQRSRGPLIRSVVEWADAAFKAPAFALRVGPEAEAPADPLGIRSAMVSAVHAVRAASGHPVAEPPGPPEGFPQSKRDELDSIMGRGTVEGAPGYLVLREAPRFSVWTSREGKFPYPWEIEAYLDRADRVRQIFVS